ncbi:uncharacterized protein RJT20DRAFT_129682 [Scheffersomyces xylosifermentans]|uniref:uncharacterized protein n=1 Tax=Scheffersomyces xylosifermentans TaxID=1304137 RepID=UPI00315C7DCB
MSHSLSLISKYLDSEKRQEIALELSRELDNSPENIDALCEILNGHGVNSDVFVNIFDYSVKCVYSTEGEKEERYENIVKLAKTLLPLRNRLLNTILSSLKSYIKENHNFIPEFNKLIKVNEIENVDIEEDLSDEVVLSLFQFLEYLFIKIPDLEANESIDNVLLKLIGINDENISSITSKLLRWRIKTITSKYSKAPLIWEIIFALERSDKKYHKSHAFILWLCYIDNSLLSQNKICQDTLKTDQYWEVLQNGLVSDSHEFRKFCLSILQLSIKLINSSFSNNFITWDTEKKNVYLNEWSRYITLFEIMAIDTSLHQAEAATKDIIGLISPNSVLHPSWGFCLLSTGFKATMDSVRKFSLGVLLSIPDEHLYLIKHGLRFLEDVFLPYAMLASHFAVRPVDGVNQCSYGERITSFIANMLINLKTEKEYEDVVLSILKVMDNLKESFDASRIYISRGIILGLEGKNVLNFDIHRKPLLNLFETRAEGDLFEKAYQTINLRILLHFKVNSKTLLSFMELLDFFTKFNGFHIFNENLSLIKKYLNDNYIRSHSLLELFMTNAFTNEARILAIKLLAEDCDEEIMNYLYDCNESLFASLIQIGYDLSILKDHCAIEEYFIHFDRLSKSESHEADLYSSLAAADLRVSPHLIPPQSSLILLWESIKEESQSDKLEILELLHRKFTLFNNIYGASSYGFVKVGDVISFYSNLLSNSDELVKSVKLFYKLKEEILGDFYQLLEIASSKEKLQNIDEILKLLNSNSSNYQANLSMAQLLNNYLSSQSTISTSVARSIVAFLSDLWKSLDSSRLQLNQKDLHVLIIDTIMHPRLLEVPATDEMNSKFLEFSISVISNSQGRRSLLPALTRNLSNFQIAQSDKFESIEWIPEVLVRAFVVFQLRTNVFKMENVIGEIFDKELSLDKTSNLYESIYGPEEVSSKINLMVILNSINNSSFANKIIAYIFDNEDDLHLQKVLKSTDGLEEWTRIQLFTIIVSLLDIAEFESKFDLFIGLIDSEPSPLPRAYLEWIIAYNLLKSEEHTKQIFESLLDDIVSLKPSVVTSYERILFLMIQQLDPQSESNLLSKFLTVVIPGATSNKATTRHFSLSLVVSIYSEITNKKLTLDDSLVEMVSNMYHSAAASDSFGQYRSGDALLWNIKEDLTLVSISGGVLMRISDRESIDFITSDAYLKYLTPSQAQHLRHDVGSDFQNLWIKDRKTSKKVNVKNEVETQSPLQTKSGAWNTVMDVDESSRGKEVDRSDLIVVSSLVDKPPNLGGICRLCDVLGAGLMTLNDIKVKNHPQFKNVAVTADSWMPMVEVKPEEIKEFLREKKREGYTLIGLEQTDKSVELNNELKFPKKSLILLGREKEGVPGDLLAELDLCVEIKQVGVIRSMNIQTATAIIVHAYSTQHC